MKIKTCFLILLFSSSLCAQEKQDSSKLKNKFNKVQIGINFSPDQCYRTLKSENPDSTILGILKQREAFEIPCLGFTAGVNFRYALTKILAIEMGLQIANKRFQTNDFAVIGGSFPIMPSSALYIYNHYYAEVPLLLNAVLGTNKLKISADLGIITGFFLHYTNTYDVFDPNGKLTEQKTKTYSGFNSLNFSPTVSLGLSYDFNKRSGISLEPTYRYGLVKIKKAPVHEYLWSIGLNIGYHIQL